MVPRKANTPTLTREQIVAAALVMVDRDGLDALSMRKLASALGVGPMSLYYHVPDKAGLHELILEAIMLETALTSDDPSASIEARIMRIAYSLRAALLAHPNAAILAMNRPMRTPGQLRPVELILGILFDAGLTPTQAMSTVNVIGQYVIGTTLSYAGHFAESERADSTTTEDLSVLVPEEFPNLVRAASEAEYAGWDADFDDGLRALVKGLVLDKMKA